MQFNFSNKFKVTEPGGAITAQSCETLALT
jgi:hypothetical protein